MIQAELKPGPLLSLKLYRFKEALICEQEDWIQQHWLILYLAL